MSDAMKRGDYLERHAPVNGSDPGSNLGFRAGSVHIRDYLRVLYKHRWPVATALTLIMGLSLLYNLTRVPTYEARVQLLIEASTENVVNFKEVVAQDKANSSYYQTQILLLQSRSLARRTIEALDLKRHPELLSLNSPGTRMARFADAIFSPVSTLKSAMALVNPPALPGTVPSQGDAESEAVDALLSRLNVAPVEESRLVEAKFVAHDPAVAANVVNALADQFIQQHREMKFEASRGALDWLREKLREQQKEVEKSELTAQQYRERHDPLSSDDTQSIVMQQLAALSAAVTRAKTERIGREAQYRQLEQIRGTNSDLDQLPGVMSSPLVQGLEKELTDLKRQKAQLSDRFGEKHPQIVKLTAGIESTRALLAAEVDKAVSALRNQLEASAAEERRLEAAVEAQKQEALNLNRMAIGYGTLERDASSSRQIFDTLIQRLKEAGIVGGLETSDIRIVDRAEIPRAPVRQTRANLIMSFLFGTMLSIGLAFFLEYVDSTVKSPEELRSHLRLPFLGMLPICPAGANHDLPLVSRVKSTHFSEAVQGVCTNVLFSTGSGDAPKTLMVTSTQPIEGKTVVAANLAISLGQIGMRVLLVDGDMRRPSLHKTFGENRTPGLSGVLAGDDSVASAVRQTDERNVFLLPAGASAPHPAVLLQSPRFRDILKGLATEYDWVIIDAPPVMPVTDASIVAAQVSGVLFVVASEMTSRYAAMNALNQLEQASAGFVGAVLNRVDVVRHAYYYSNYYDRKYTSYYCPQRAT